MTPASTLVRVMRQAFRPFILLLGSLHERGGAEELHPLWKVHTRV
jgi:hypothetical protein